MKNTTKNTITKAVEFVLRAVSVTAFFTLMLSLIGMIEAMSASETPLTLAIVSAAWLTIVCTYAHIVNK